MSEPPPIGDLSLEGRQRAVCEKHGAEFLAAPLALKAGVALNVQTGLMPINGLRHPPEAGTSGWFIWAGEALSRDPDFFKPLHVTHLSEWAPLVLPYLELGPGWRFLLAENYVDVWCDDSLLHP